MDETPGGLAALRSADDLFALFGETAPPASSVAELRVPEPYHGLLAHESHMTVTLEGFHRTRVRLDVLAVRLADPLYARKILLRHGETGAVVLLGIMQFDLEVAAPAMRAEILSREKPLGRILLEHGVLTRIGMHGLLAFEPVPELLRRFELPPTWSRPLYGRLATIFCDDRPAVDLLEIVRPEPGHP